MTKHYFLGFDTETDEKGAFKIGCLYGEVQKQNGKVVHYDLVTEDKNEIIEILNQTRLKDTYLTMFNAQYDLNTLYPEYRRESKFWKGSFFGFKSHKHSEIKALDLMGKWFQGKSLKQLAEDWECNYIDIHDIRHILIKHACRSHTITTYQIAVKLEQMFHNLGYDMIPDRINHMPTASGTAFTIWKKMENQDPYNSWDKDMNMYSGASYHGGRCEVFNKNMLNIHYYDVVSMYPSVMKNNSYPNPNVPFEECLKPEKFTEILNNYEGFADCKIHIGNMKIPPLAKVHQNKLLFPAGNWEDTLNFVDIRFLNDLKLKGYDVSWSANRLFYTESWQPFNEYIDIFWKVKENKQTKPIGKLLLNALSGKFSQRNRSEGEWCKYEGEIPQPGCEIKNKEVYADLIDTLGEYSELDTFTFAITESGSWYFKASSEDGIMTYSHYPLLSSYITSYSRRKLWYAMESVGFENVVYCDTDSLVLTKELSGDFIGNTLGCFKKEWEGKFQSIAPKKYKFLQQKPVKKCYWEYKANGIPKKAQTQFWSDPGCYINYKAPVRLQEFLRTKHDEYCLNQWIDHIKMFREQPKRLFANNGTSEPFIINE